MAIVLAPSAVGALAARAASDLRFALNQAARPDRAFRFDGVELEISVVALVLPILFAVALAAGVALAVQTGGIIASKRLAPRFDRLDPIAGFKSLLSGARLFVVVRAFAAGSVTAWLAWVALRGHVVDFARLAGRTRPAGALVHDVASELLWRAALVGVALGVLDFYVTRRAWFRKLRMSKDEVKRELRETEGDPQLKAARERAYQELLSQAAIANVRGASVVVVNPTRLACALRYDELGGDEAPFVVASGSGETAGRIVQAARDFGVPVVQDVPLARALVELEVGRAIPEALYEAVAEILRELWREAPRLRPES